MSLATRPVRRLSVPQMMPILAIVAIPVSSLSVRPGASLSAAASRRSCPGWRRGGHRWRYLLRRRATRRLGREILAMFFSSQKSISKQVARPARRESVRAPLPLVKKPLFSGFAGLWAQRPGGATLLRFEAARWRRRSFRVQAAQRGALPEGSALAVISAPLSRRTRQRSPLTDSTVPCEALFSPMRLATNELAGRS